MTLPDAVPLAIVAAKEELLAPRWIQSFSHLDRVPQVFRCARRIESWWPFTRGYIKLGETSYPYQFRTRSGLELELRDFYELGTAWVVFCRDEYVVPPNARTVIDLGANYGAFTLLAAVQAPRATIVSLEPFPSTFDRLVLNVRRNGFESRVRCWPLALGPRDGEQKMDSTPGVGSHMRHLIVDGDSRETSIAVSTISWPELLSRVRSQLGIDEIDLVKMDIEGAEHDVFPDMSTEEFRGIRAWQMEYHNVKSKVPLFAALERSGLRCQRDTVYAEDQGVAHFTRD